MDNQEKSPYISFNHDEWSKLRLSTPLTLTENDLNKLIGINEHISLEEVSKIFLPLSRLLNLYVSGTQNLNKVTHTFLGTPPDNVPYIIGIAGSVAVGKSTTARIIQALLSRWPNHPKVDLVTTDGFLYPNKVLEERGQMNKKGFPESYDVRRFTNFLSDVKSGCIEVKAPVYSHLTYDIVPDKYQIVNKPDILIVEGLNILQIPKEKNSNNEACPLISDFFDFTIYVHAEEKDIMRWFFERFQILRQTAFQDKNSYFHRFASLTDNEANEFAEKVWREINGLNLAENIYPTHQRARLILEKGNNHFVQKVKLRKL